MVGVEGVLDPPATGTCKALIPGFARGGTAMLTIGQLARAGSTAKTIRYYEEVGVLPPAPRNGAGYRQYSRVDVDRLLFIRRARALGLSLTDLKVLVGDLQAEKCAALRPGCRRLSRSSCGSFSSGSASFNLLSMNWPKSISG